MKNITIIGAYGALKELSMLKLPMKTAYAVYKMLKKADECYNFFIAEERKLIEKYNGEVDPATGRISFNDADVNMAFQMEYAELHTLDIDWDLAPVCLNLDVLSDDCKLTPSDFAALAEFITVE